MLERSNLKVPPFRLIVLRSGDILRLRRYLAELEALAREARRTHNLKVLHSAVAVIARQAKALGELFGGGEL